MEGMMRLMLLPTWERITYLLASADEKRVKSDIRKEELELKKREAAIREKELGI